MTPLRDRLRAAAASGIPPPVAALLEVLSRAVAFAGDRLDAYGPFAFRGVTFARVDDFFPPALTAEARAHWHASLEVFVADLPPCDDVLTPLRALLLQYLPELPC